MVQCGGWCSVEGGWCSVEGGGAGRGGARGARGAGCRVGVESAADPHDSADDDRHDEDGAAHEVGQQQGEVYLLGVRRRDGDPCEDVGRAVSKREEGDARDVGLEPQVGGDVAQLRDEEGVRRAAQRRDQHRQPHTERQQRHGRLAKGAVPVLDVRAKVRVANLSAVGLHVRAPILGRRRGEQSRAARHVQCGAAPRAARTGFSDQPSPCRL